MQSQPVPIDDTSRPSVAVTGIGAVTSLGLNVKETFARMKAGECGLRPLTAVESKLDPDKGGGQAVDLPTDPNDQETLSREVRYLRLAVTDALISADLYDNWLYEPVRCGVLMGTTLHGMRTFGEFLRTKEDSVLTDFLAGGVIESAFANFPLEGLAVTTCSACSSGLASVSLAVTLLQTGELDLIVAGGYDPISEYAYGGFNCMRLVTADKVKPFCRDRAGLKVAEGYGVLVLERQEQAIRRGATPLARIAGVGASCDAHHLSQPHPKGRGAAEAMRMAMHRAGVSPEEIDLIAAHGTATPDNDGAEYLAMETAFGDTLPNVPVVALKSHLGHTLGAAGAVELVLTIKAMQERTIVPCPNITDETVEFEELRIARDLPESKTLSHTLNTSLGFGGANTCLVLEMPNDGTSASADRQRSTPASIPYQHAMEHDFNPVITGVGVILNQDVGLEAFRDSLNLELRCWGERLADVTPPNVDDLLNARRARRMSDYAKRVIAATRMAFENAGITETQEFGEGCPAILGSAHGPAEYCESYYRKLVEEGIDAANPLLFAEGVPNAGAAHTSTTFGLTGFCQTVIGTRTAGLDALRLAATHIRSGLWSRAVVSAAEERASLIERVYRNFGLHADSHSIDANNAAGRSGFIHASGAVAVILESNAHATARNATVLGQVGRACSTRGRAGDRKSHARHVGHVYDQIGSPTLLFTSANGTWIDRVEQMGVRHAEACRSDSRKSQPRMVSLTGLYPEMFSVGPLASVVALLINSRLPRALDTITTRDDEPVASDSLDGSLGVICSDYTGLVTGLEICKQRT